jgi:hypothetical protein
MSDQKSKRKKIPTDIEAEVIFQSNRLCCIDQKRGDHIHHIDGNNSNYEFSNLAFLCFDCHDEVSRTGSLRKRLTPKAILKFRDHHYSVIKNMRDQSLGILNNPIKSLTTEDLIDASTTATILIEITKIKKEYYDCGLIDRNIIIQKLDEFSTHSNARIAFEVFSFLIKVAYETRSGLPIKMIETIFSLVMNFFPPPDILRESKQLNEVGNQCISIAFTLVYDSTIHRKNFEISSFGLLILKYIYIQSKKLKVPQLTSKVLETYTELERQLTRPERNDLLNAKELMNIFKQDLDNSDLSFPPFSKDLYKIIDLQKIS